ncbi:MAG: hypothetical protein ACREJP_07085, partial [Candidatus Methylomirabilales bacterium]
MGEESRLLKDDVHRLGHVRFITSAKSSHPRPCAASPPRRPADARSCGWRGKERSLLQVRTRSFIGMLSQAWG